MQWVCPECGFEILEEIMVDCKVFNEIEHLKYVPGTDSIDVMYGEQDVDGGTVDSLMCAGCSLPVDIEEFREEAKRKIRGMENDE